MAIVKLLVSRGADVNAGGNLGKTALQIASEGGLTDGVLLLLDKGADVAGKDSEGQTALHWVNKPEIAGLLIAHGADVNAKTQNGTTPLHHVVNADIAEMLLAHGADVNAKITEGYDLLGYTPLHCAAESPVDKKSVVQVLLAHGADPNATEPRLRRTPLHLAARLGRKGVAELMIKAGANVDARRQDGSTPLLEALYHKHVEMATMLVEKGCDVNMINTETGEGPLHLAAWVGAPGLVELLLKRGADPRLRTKEDGRTALDVARMFGHKDVADLISGYDANHQRK